MQVRFLLAIPPLARPVVDQIAARWVLLHIYLYNTAFRSSIWLLVPGRVL